MSEELIIEQGVALSKALGENYKLERRVRELEAHCERLRACLDKHTGWQDNSDGTISRMYPYEVADLLEETPAQSLQAIRAEAVRDFAEWAIARTNLPVDELDIEPAVARWIKEQEQ